MAGELNVRRKRIVIVGGGFAGIAAARAFKRCDAEIVLIDQRNHHIFQPLLYQVATAVLAPSEIAAPIRQLAYKQKNVSVILAEVTGVDLNSRSLDASYPGGGARKLQFDYLVIATGMRPSYFGHREFAKYAPGLKNLTDAETIRAKILSAYELADMTDDENERARQMTFVLVGAGPTGVELAASMAQLAAVTLRGQFRRIAPARSSIILIEGGKRILPTFAERLAQRAARRLEKLGVRIMTGVKVEKVDENGVVADGKRIPSATVLWTAGVAPSPLVKLLVPRPIGPAVSVGPFMNVADVTGVFVVGRCVIGRAQWAAGAWRGASGDPARALCWTPDLTVRSRDEKPKHPFRYFDKGNMAVVGKNFAILESGRLRMSGFVTWLIWVFLHLMSLPQLQNRLRVQSQWFWSYFTGQRGSRLIPELPRVEG